MVFDMNFTMILPGAEVSKIAVEKQINKTGKTKKRTQKMELNTLKIYTFKRKKMVISFSKP